MDRLQKQSFGLIMLLLAIVAIAPGISIVGGLLMLIPAFQMIAGRTAPVFPRWITDRPLPTKHLGAVVQRASAPSSRSTCLVDLGANATEAWH